MNADTLLANWTTDMRLCQFHQLLTQKPGVRLVCDNCASQADTFGITCIPYVRWVRWPRGVPQIAYAIFCHACWGSVLAHPVQHALADPPDEEREATPEEYALVGLVSQTLEMSR